MKSSVRNLFSQRLRGAWPVYLAALSLVFATVVAAGNASYAFDSSIYISAAESLLKGKGLLSTYFGIIPNKDFLPLSFYPPGFSCLIALFAWPGISPAFAAVLIPKICFVLLPFAFYFVLYRISSPRTAFIIALISMYSAVTVKFSLMAMTDVPYLFFSLISIGLMIEAIEKERGILAFLSGLTVGGSMLLRLVGSALIPGIAAGLIAGIFLQIIPGKTFRRLSIAFSVGCALVLIPYFWRNFTVFHTPVVINDHFRQSASWLFIAGEYAQSMAYLYFGDRKHVFLLGVLVFTLICFLIGRAKTFYLKTDASRKKIIYGLILAGYMVSGSCAVISMASRFTYQVEDRYLIPYAWIMVAATVYLLNAGLQRVGITEHRSRAAVAGLMTIAFFLIQTFVAVDQYLYFKNRNIVSKELTSQEKIMREIPSSSLLVANEPDMLQRLLRRNVRMLNGYTPSGLIHFIGDNKDFFVLLHLGRVSENESWRPVSFGRLPYGYKVFYVAPNLVILRHDRGEPNP